MILINFLTDFFTNPVLMSAGVSWFIAQAAKVIIESVKYGFDRHILGRSGIRKALETGRGTIVMRAKTHIEDMNNGKKRIIVDEIPYMVNKASMVEKIAQLARDKQVEGITDLRDESNMNGVRVVIELRKDTQPEVLLNQLYKLSPLQTNFGVNNVVLFGKTPHMTSMKEMLQGYIDHQVDVITRRTQYDLKKAQDRAHILEGLRIAVDNLDAIIHTIRNSKDANEAMPRLMEGFNLDEIQAKAILDMQFRRLTGLEREKIENEYQDLLVKIADYQDILSHHERIMQIIHDELTVIKDKYGNPRKTEIIDAPAEMEDEDLIPVEHVIISLSSNGYVKRMTSDTYRVQNRGGKGIKGMELNKDDAIDQFINMSTHDFLLIFTNTGRVFRVKGYNIPEFSRTSKGIPMINLIAIDKNEKVTAMVPYGPDDKADYLFFATKKGIIKRTPVNEFENINRNGKIAIKLNEGDELAFVKSTNGNDEILIAGSNGKAIRITEDSVRPMSRTAMGVKGFNTDGGSVIGMATNAEGKYILTITENGYGKMSELADFRMTNRGAKGVKAHKVTDKTGSLVCMRAVTGDEDCMIMTEGGIVIRISLTQVNKLSRDSQGVRVISVKGDSKVSAVSIIDPEEVEEEQEAETPAQPAEETETNK